MKQTIIIEHLEPKLWPWCIIEYKSIASLIPKNNLWFTNVKQKTNKLFDLGKIYSKSVEKMNLNNVCVLDPDAKKTLTPKEAKSFNYFIIGGILGDYPPKKRTRIELTNKLKHAQARNMGKKQFSTDNAVYVLKEIIRGKNIKNQKFQNKLTIPINKIESIDLPYYYPLIKGKPRIS
ncbi:MAG: SAM-dependent methyltransferase, partial [Nanoarchaeota archaeon]